MNPKAKIHRTSLTCLQLPGTEQSDSVESLLALLHPDCFSFHKSALNQNMCLYHQKIALSAVTLFKMLAHPQQMEELQELSPDASEIRPHSLVSDFQRASRVCRLNETRSHGDNVDSELISVSLAAGLFLNDAEGVGAFEVRL